jgi:peroxiredoxin
MVSKIKGHKQPIFSAGFATIKPNQNNTPRKLKRMKNILIISALCLTTISVKAQSDSVNNNAPKVPPMPKTLIMPDGSVVPTRKLDSIQKVFGGRAIIFSFRDDGVYIHPAETASELSESEKKLQAHVNKPAPEFAFKGLNGKRYSLAHLKGKVVVLNFWYTQCGGCIQEMPKLNELTQSYSGKDVVFLAITFDDKAKVNAFLAKKAFDYTIIPNARKSCVDYDLDGYPTSVVIDRNGIVRFITDSIKDDVKSQLAKAIDEVEKPIVN